MVSKKCRYCGKEVKIPPSRNNQDNYFCNMQCYKKSTDVFYEMVKTYKQTLQEIKKIAEKPKLFKDFSEIKTATEVEYDYAAICNELELRLHKVLELITKAEEE